MGVLQIIRNLLIKIIQVNISGKGLEMRINFRYCELPSFTGYRCILGKLVLMGKVPYMISQKIHSWYAGLSS